MVFVNPHNRRRLTGASRAGSAGAWRRAASAPCSHRRGGAAARAGRSRAWPGSARTRPRRSPRSGGASRTGGATRSCGGGRRRGRGPAADEETVARLVEAAPRRGRRGRRRRGHGRRRPRGPSGWRRPPGRGHRAADESRRGPTPPRRRPPTAGAAAALFALHLRAWKLRAHGRVVAAPVDTDSRRRSRLPHAAAVPRRRPARPRGPRRALGRGPRGRAAARGGARRRRAPPPAPGAGRGAGRATARRKGGRRVRRRPRLPSGRPPARRRARGAAPGTPPSVDRRALAACDLVELLLDDNRVGDGGAARWPAASPPTEPAGAGARRQLRHERRVGAPRARCGRARPRDGGAARLDLARNHTDDRLAPWICQYAPLARDRLLGLALEGAWRPTPPRASTRRATRRRRRRARARARADDAAAEPPGDRRRAPAPAEGGPVAAPSSARSRRRSGRASLL